MRSVPAKVRFAGKAPAGRSPAATFVAPHIIELDDAGELTQGGVRADPPRRPLAGGATSTRSSTRSPRPATASRSASTAASTRPPARSSTALPVGNVYVNRNMIGAVVGTQPFGGSGLSGTGPKAGGPDYLRRFALEQVVSTNTAAAGGNASLIAIEDE